MQSFKRNIASLLVRLGCSDKFIIHREGHRLRFFPTSLSKTLWSKPSLRNEEKFIQMYLSPGDIYIDVGANIGTLVLVAAGAIGKTGRVIALEPNPTTFKYLRENINLNNYNDRVNLHHAGADNEQSVTTITSKKSDVKNQLGSGSIEVKVVRLDDLLSKGIASIKLLKIDVEGYEKFVLEGAEKTLSLTETVYFEAWDEHYREFGYSSADVFAILHSHGFTILMESDKKWIEVPATYSASKRVNLVATRKPAEIQDMEIPE